MKPVVVAVVLVLGGCASGSPGSEPGQVQAPVNPYGQSPSPAVDTTLPATTLPATTLPPATPPTTTDPAGPPTVIAVDEYPVAVGSRPHDVAPAAGGGVWYTAQRAGRLDHLDPDTGQVTEVPLGSGSSPHGVVTDAEGNAWVTDTGLNALVRVDGSSRAVDVYPVPVPARMHTPAVAPDGMIWFTGQAGYVGRFDPATGEMNLFETGGGGPYGITVTPSGDVYFAALAGSFIGHVDPESGVITRIQPPTPDQGARRVWSDSAGSIWVAYWNTGHLARYHPGSGNWDEWRLPGNAPQAYAVYVDETDRPWVSDFGDGHALLRFDPATETFDSFPLPTPGSGVRQLLGRPGEVWGAESAADALVVVRYQR